MKLIALVDLPKGQHPGDLFEVADDVGDALVSFGVAKRADDVEHKKRTYKRRDLVAEDTRHLSAGDV